MEDIIVLKNTTNENNHLHIIFNLGNPKPCGIPFWIGGLRFPFSLMFVAEVNWAETVPYRRTVHSGLPNVDVARFMQQI